MARVEVTDLLISRFVNGGRGQLDNEGVRGFDCWGAVMETFERYGVDVPDFDEHPDNPLGIGFIFDEQAKSGLWERLNSPETPCLVVMSTSLQHPDACNHFGVFVGDNKFFHMQRKRGPHLDRLDVAPWPRCVKSFWRWVGEESALVRHFVPNIPDGKAMVVFMPNFMDPRQKVIEFVDPGQSVAAYSPAPSQVEGVLDVSGVLELAASLNGVRLSSMEERSVTLRAGDSLLFKVVPHGGGGGGGKNPIAMVASLALMVVAPYISAPLMGLTGAWGLSSAGLMLAEALPGMIAFGGAALVNAVLPPGKPGSPSLGSPGLEESPTYSWAPQANPTQNGSPVAVLYGEKVNITPFLLTRYIETDGDKQYLNLLFMVAEGPLDAEGIFDIKINDNPIENYEGVEVDVRLGSANQAPIQWFNDTISERSVGRKLTTEWATVEGVGTAIKALGIGFSFPKGLGEAQGLELKSLAVTIEVERRKDDGEWIVWDEYEVSGSQRSALRRYWRKNDLGGSGKHDVRARFKAAPPEGLQYLSECWFEYIHEIVPDDFSLPHTAAFGLRALATDQLSGSRPRVTCSAKRSLVDVWNPSTEQYEQKAASNMAWAAWDLAHHYRYGGGFLANRIIYNDFELAAQWCDTKGISGALYIDRANDIQTYWDYMGRFGRFRVVKSGTRVGCVSDRPVDIPEQGMIVTEANVLLGTFGTEYLNTTDRADAIRVTYFDKVKGRTTFLVVSEFYGQITGRAPRVREETLYCCDDYQLAWAWATYMLRCNRYLVETIQRTMAVEAIGALPGDVIQAATIFGSQTARISSDSSIGMVKLNAPVTLEPAKNYKIWVKHTDRQSPESKQELVECKDVAGVLELTTTDSLFISGALQYAPSEGAVAAFGEPNTTVKWYRIVSITRAGTSKLRRQIKALEYAPEVYEDEGVAPVLESAASGAAVSGLQAGIFDRFEDGVQKKVVSLFWRGFALEWQVYVRRPSTTLWKWVCSTRDPVKDIYNLEMGYRYEFSVTDRSNPSDGEKVVIEFSNTGSGLLQPVTVLNESGEREPVFVSVEGVKFPVEVVM